MAKLLFQEDSYIREFDATILDIKDNKVFLDRTAFHPGPSGGLDTDRGWLILPDGTRFSVDRVVKEGEKVVHIVSGDIGLLKPGLPVHGVLDWERRYRIMRLHTASHIIAALLFNSYGAKVTGGHIAPDVARDDFDLRGVENWKEVLRQVIDEANNVARRCIEVRVYWLPREEALKIPGIVKLAGRLPPNVEKIRVVEIPGVDIQADGGPHVKNTCEIGTIEFVKVESKGARRRRLYYTVSP